MRKFTLLCIVLVEGILFSTNLIAQQCNTEVAPGYSFWQEASYPGVSAYRQGSNYVFVIDLSKGAGLDLGVLEKKAGDNSLAPEFKHKKIGDHFNYFFNKAYSKGPINYTPCFVFNAQIFATGSGGFDNSYTKIHYPLKVTNADGTFINAGSYMLSQSKERWYQSLKISNQGYATIKNFPVNSITNKDENTRTEYLKNEKEYENIIVGTFITVGEKADDFCNKEEELTLIGVKDKIPNTENYRKIVVFIGKSKRNDAAQVLCGFGVPYGVNGCTVSDITRIIQLDGGGSTQAYGLVNGKQKYLFKSSDVINACAWVNGYPCKSGCNPLLDNFPFPGLLRCNERQIPQAIGIKSAPIMSIPGGIDFREVSITGLHLDPNTNELNFVMKAIEKQAAGDNVVDVQSKTEQLKKYFLQALAIPAWKQFISLDVLPSGNNMYVKSARTESPFQNTDLARHFFQADVEMKNDLFTDPLQGTNSNNNLNTLWSNLIKQSPYFNYLKSVGFYVYPCYFVQGQILPDQINANNQNGIIYIQDAKMKVDRRLMNYGVNLSNYLSKYPLPANVYSDEMSRLQVWKDSLYNRLVKGADMVTTKINGNDPAYATLRELYPIVGLANWYKSLNTPNKPLQDFINKENLTDIAADPPFDKTYWDKMAYQPLKNYTFIDFDGIPVNGTVWGGVTLGGTQIIDKGPLQATQNHIDSMVIKEKTPVKEGNAYYFYGGKIKLPAPQLYPQLMFSNTNNNKVGDSLLLQVNVFNTGEVKANNVKVKIYEHYQDVQGNWQVKNLGVQNIDSVSTFGIVPFTKLWIPAHEGTNKIQVVVDEANVIKESNEADNQITDSMLIAPQYPVPVVSITQPLANDTFFFAQPIIFKGFATDPEDGIIPANKLIWTSSLNDTLGTGDSLNLSNLKAGYHNIRLTTTDSDGWITYKERNIYIEAPHAPVISIITPKNNAVFSNGDTILLKVYAHDYEEGILNGNRISWSSSIDGALGKGNLLSITSLSIGTHTLTATAKDTIGLTSSANIQITIEQRKPVAQILSPDEGTIVTTLDTILFQANATDYEDGVLSGNALVWTSSTDGMLGTGNNLKINTLSPGTHFITLTATDAGNKSDKQTILLYIQQAGITGIISQFPGNKNCISFSASGLDTVFYIDLPKNAHVTYASFLIQGKEYTHNIKLLPGDAQTNKSFGCSVSTNGDWALVGAKGNDTIAGSAYIYQYNGKTWIQKQKLTANNSVAGDGFGCSVAISDNVAIIGSNQDDNNKGAAYIYRYNGNSWVQEQKLTTNDGIFGEEFGYSVGISGNIAIIAAFGNGNYKGAAYIYRYNGNSWIQEQKLVPADIVSGDAFGTSVAISGNKAIVGAYLDNDKGISSGSVYIYMYNGVNWIEEKLTASDGSAGDYFGCSVAISGSTVIVGAPFDVYNYNNKNYQGSAYIYEYNGLNWIEEKLSPDMSLHAPYFGCSVSISGNKAIGGAWGGGSKSAVIFSKHGNNWEMDQNLSLGDLNLYGGHAAAVYLSGNTAIIGAVPYSDNPNGLASVHIYKLNSYPYTPSIDISNNGNKEWTYPGTLKSNELTGNLAAAFNDYLDNYNGANNTIAVPIRIKFDSTGTLELCNLNIQYTIADVKPPVISQAQLTPNPVYVNNTTEVQITATDNDAIDSVIILFNGNTYLADSTAPNTFNKALFADKAGEFPVKIIAYDVNGLSKDTTLYLKVLNAGTDLAVNAADISTTPAFPDEGDMLKVNAIVKNYGTTDEKKVQVYLYAKNQFINSAIIASLPAGGEANINFNWKSQLEKDSLKIVIDPYNNITEVNENNNMAAIAIPVADITPPDITQLSALPNPVFQNKEVIIRLKANDNAGIDTVKANWLGQEKILLYNPSGKYYENTFTATTLGKHEASCTVQDINGLISAQTLSIEVLPLLADLSLSPFDVHITASTANPGQEVIVNVKIHNEGGAEVNNTPVEFTVDGKLQDAQTITLKAQSDTILYFPWTVNCNKHLFTFTADPSNTIAEIDENNNTASMQIFLCGPGTPAPIAIPATWTKQPDFLVQWHHVTDFGAITEYQYSLNHGNWMSNALDTAVSITAPSDDIHTVAVRSINNNGKSSPGQTYLYLNATPPNTPVIIESHCGTNWTRHDSPYLSWLNPGDAGSGVEKYVVSMDKQAPTDIGNTLFYHPTVTSGGKHTFKIKAVDKVGNESNWSEPVTVYIDLDTPDNAPIHSSTHPDQNTWYNNDSVYLYWNTPKDTSFISGYYYLFDNAPTTVPSTYGFWYKDSSIAFHTLPVMTPDPIPLPDGEWHFHLASADGVGRMDTKASHYKIRIDKTAPYTTADVPEIIESNTATFQLHAEDYTSGVKETNFRINGDSWTKDSTVNLSTPGKNLIEYYSTDNAGNIEKTDTIYVTIGKGELNVDIYPNPNTGEFDIVLTNAAAASLQIKMTNVLGQTVFTKELKDITGNHTEKIDVSAISPAIYFLNVSVNDKVIVKKVLIE